MATANSTIELHHFKYYQLPWGDLIYGTKDQLQGIGIARGMPFPGESGGPKRSLKVIDPRGFSTTVKMSHNDEGEGIYSASINFPNREKQKDVWTDFTTGVKKSTTSCWWCDEYIGTAEALILAGLVREDQLPGKPGMRKTKVTIYADGTIPNGTTKANSSKAKEPGAKYIDRASKTTYSVRVRIQEEEEERRGAEIKNAQLEWEARMQALPRPSPLVVLHHTAHASVIVAPKYRIDGNVIHILAIVK